VHREVGSVPIPRFRRADPHPVWIWSADRLSAHCGRDVSKMLFGDLHRTQPLGLADATCSVLCATASPVGACWCNSRIFGSRPRWQASGCSFAPTRGHQRQETDFLRPRILTPFEACHQETLPVRTIPVNYFSYGSVNRYFARFNMKRGPRFIFTEDLSHPDGPWAPRRKHQTLCVGRVSAMPTNRMSKRHG
jgi:hypothetical protein